MQDRQNTKSQPATECQDRGRDEDRDKTLTTEKDHLGKAAEEEVQGAGGVVKYLACFGWDQIIVELLHISQKDLFAGLFDILTQSTDHKLIRILNSRQGICFIYCQRLKP